MEIKPLVLVLADISGYTRFIKWHRLSLIHAEKIITELLESVIDAASAPLVLHELEGDAVTFYALEPDGATCAGEVLAQVERFFDAFRRREAELVSDCSGCVCEACRQVGQLKIKVVLHRGTAVFTRLRQFDKVAGEDVILAHRLLKNSVPSDEYLLMTEAFASACPDLPTLELERRTEQAEGLGEVTVFVRDYEPRGPVAPAPRTLWGILKMTGVMEGYVLRRLVAGPSRSYRHLQDA